MKSSPGTYILSMINHKETYEVTEDIHLFINKSFENNLRDRNPQLGIVEAICEEDNPYNLIVGDIVAVNHFTFYGDIGKDRSFTLQPHFEYEGKKYFKVLGRNIFFKYNDKTPEIIGDFILCKDVKENDTLNFDPNTGNFFHTKEFTQEGVISHGNEKYPNGERILVLKSAFYLITLDKIDYFKVKQSEIVAFIKDGQAIPTDRNLLIEYVEKEDNHFLDLSLMKKDNNVTAKIIKGEIKHPKRIMEWGISDTNIIGMLLRVWRNQGVPYDGKWIIDDEMILWKYEN